MFYLRKSVFSWAKWVCIGNQSCTCSNRSNYFLIQLFLQINCQDIFSYPPSFKMLHLKAVIALKFSQFPWLKTNFQCYTLQMHIRNTSLNWLKLITYSTCCTEFCLNLENLPQNVQSLSEWCHDNSILFYIMIDVVYSVV